MNHVSKSKKSPSPSGEGLGVRSNLTKQQIEVTMFAAGVGTFEGLKVEKLLER